MERFAFHPELFELRNAVLEMLADQGFAWLSEFSSIDLLHDVYTALGGAISEAGTSAGGFFNLRP